MHHYPVLTRVLTPFALLAVLPSCYGASVSFTTSPSGIETTIAEDVTLEFTSTLNPVFLDLYVLFDDAFDVGTSFAAFTGSSTISAFGITPQQVTAGVVNGNNPSTSDPRDYSLRFSFGNPLPRFFTGDQVVLSAGTHFANVVGATSTTLRSGEYDLQILDAFGNVVGGEILIQPPGSSPDNPILPTDDPGPAFGGVCGNSDFFCIAVGSEENQGPAGDPIWVDPEVAVGYDYDLLDGPNFASVTLPTGFGDDSYELFVFNDATLQFDFAATLSAMQTFDFTTLDPAGVSKFRVLGIEPSAMVDPTDPLGFPTGLTFAAAGEVAMTMTAIVPEPASSWFVVAGLLLGGFARRA